ncbi:MAG: Ig-like domain-containing protein [Hormoscilla sp.]
MFTTNGLLRTELIMELIMDNNDLDVFGFGTDRSTIFAESTGAELLPGTAIRPGGEGGQGPIALEMQGSNLLEGNFEQVLLGDIAPLDVTVANNEEAPLVLDIDRNGRLEALTDGIMIIRHLFGFAGDVVVRDAVAPDGTRTDAAEITSHIEELGLNLDVDGDGQLTALTDGLMIIRDLFGFAGEIVIRDAVAPGASRDTAEAVTAYLEFLKNLTDGPTINEPPVAVDDSFSIIQGTPAAELAVLNNDSDPDGDILSITDVADPSNGTVRIDGDRVVYNPEAGFFGIDTFTYNISDGNGGTDRATVEVTVTETSTPTPSNPGNTLGTALNITTLDGTSIFSDSVGSDDFYRLELTDRSFTSFRIADLTDNANLQVIQDRNNNGEVDFGETLDIVDRPGTTSELITTILDPDVYYIGVGRAEGDDSNYNLRVDVIPLVDAFAENFQGDGLEAGAGVINPSGDNDLFTFNGTAGDTVTAFANNLTDGGNLRIRIRLLSPDGSQLATTISGQEGSDAGIRDFVLPVSGTYSIIIVAANGDATGSYTLGLSNLSEDTTAITANQSLEESIDFVGDGDFFTFNGTAGDTVTAFVDNLTDAGDQRMRVRLLNPDGSDLAIGSSVTGGSDPEIRDQVLPVSGTYGIIVAGDGDATGDYSLSLNLV